MKNMLLLLMTVILVASCKKEIRNLPDASQTGAGTFGAKIDGENWGPLKAGILPTKPVLEARFGANGDVYINARNFSRTPIETEMEIYLKGATTTGTYLLNQQTQIYPAQSASYVYYVKRNLNIEDEWMTGSDATGQVVITRLDVPARIISGTFQFTANAKYGSAPITVTEGRFDIKVQ
jgi:hypothetical protein